MSQLVAAVSCGVYQGEAVLDLNYIEDKEASVDFNIVMTEGSQFVEVQGSGEEAVFTAEEMAAMLALGKAGIADLIAKQKVAIAAADRVERTALEDLASAFGKK
jgi:ribonuclease PH